MAWLAESIAQAAEAGDVPHLLNEVHQIPVVGVPGAIIPFGPHAFPLIVGQIDEINVLPVVAASRLNTGRIVAFSHDGYFTDKPGGDLKRLLLNAVEWAGGGRTNKPGARHVLVYQSSVLKLLQASAHHVTSVDASNWRQHLAQSDVFCIDTTFDNKPELVDAVRQFVHAGGGLVTAGTGWGWAQLNPGKRLTDDYLGNRLLMSAGLVVSERYLSGVEGRFEVHRPPPRLAGAWEALEYLRNLPPETKNLNKGDAAQACQILQETAKAVPLHDTILWPELRKLVQNLRPVPMPSKPISADHPVVRVAVAVEDAELLQLPPEKITAHPSAAGFPFAVPADAKQVTVNRSINTTIPAWHSLGLYAAPGTVITITTPKEAVGAKLAVQIGCHTDRLWNLPTWERWPNLCRRADISHAATRIASPFGGLVYVDVPENCKLGTIHVNIAGAVEAPLYVLDETDVAHWNSHIRHLPGPWAELACPGVIVTVPSRAIRDLNDPMSLMEFWNKAVSLEDSLAMYKPGERKRPERFVADQQIAAGYMHSGYPIMCGHDMYDYNVSITKLRGTASKPGGWGHWHELGHNHQSADWTPHGTGEVTVNLFTMYVINQFYGVPLERTNPDHLPREQRLPAIQKYLASKRNSENWEPFEGLILYFQLVDAFGWEPLKHVFEEYRKLGPNDHPKSDAQKWNQWMINYSRAVNKNLGPFCVKWKTPVTKPALDAIEKLPSWMHIDFKAIENQH
jgi:hypothetical protein